MAGEENSGQALPEGKAALRRGSPCQQHPEVGWPSQLHAALPHHHHHLENAQRLFVPRLRCLELDARPRLSLCLSRADRSMRPPKELNLPSGTEDLHINASLLARQLTERTRPRRQCSRLRGCCRRRKKRQGCVSVGGQGASR